MKKPSIRTIIQLVMFGIVTYLAIAHQKYGIEKAASIDAYCPMGALESFLTYITTGEFLKRIYWSSFILLGIFVLTNLFFGRIFCSHICPLGALQEWMRKFGKLLGFKDDFELPQSLDKYLRYIKYLVLLAVVISSYYLVNLFLLNNGPFAALMHFGAEFEEKIIGYSILILLLIAAIFSKNLWCRYLCPMGAFFGIIRKISFLKIKRNANTCTECEICTKSCPANLCIKEADEIENADCISCGNCVSNCPRGSLRFQIFNKVISTKKFVILIFVFMLLPLLIIPFTPIWQTKVSSNIVSKSGAIDVTNIRGSNTLEYIVKVTNIPFELFQKKLGLPDNVNMHLKLKDIGIKYDLKNKAGVVLKTEDFRKVIQNYLEN